MKVNNAEKFKILFNGITIPELYFMDSDSLLKWLNTESDFSEYEYIINKDEIVKSFLNKLYSKQKSIWHEVCDVGFPPIGETVLVTNNDYFWVDESAGNNYGSRWCSGYGMWQNTKWAYFKDVLKV